MPTDAGIILGVEGSRDFNSALKVVESQIKNLNSELRSIVTAMTGMEDSEESVTKQTDVLERALQVSGQKVEILTKQYNDAKNKLSDLEDELRKATAEFGDNSDEAIKAETAYNRQAQKVNNLGTQVNNARTQLNKFQNQMNKLKNTSNNTENSLEDVTEEMEDLKKESKETGSILKDVFTGSFLADTLSNVVGAIADVVDETAEYRKIMGTLEVSSQKAGYTADQTSQTYKQLYAVLGDNQQAATATANLQALGLSQEQLTQLTDGAIGAWAQYGDSIPIDSLAEAINETVQAGQVTGTFADVLNWAGTSEDDFNEKLAAAGTASERANIVLQELANQGLTQSAEAWRQNNAEIVAAQSAQRALTDTMAQFGEVFSPIVTEVKTGFNTILQEILSVVNAFKEGGLTGALNEVGNLFSNFWGQITENMPSFIETGSKIISDIGEGIATNLPTFVSNALTMVQEFATMLAQNAPILIQSGISMIQNLVTGIMNSIPTLISQLPTIISTIANIINDNAFTILQAGVNIIVTIVKGIISAIPTLIANIPKIITAIVDVWSAFNWINLGKNAITFLKNGIVSMVGAVKTAGTNILNSIVNIIKNLPQNLFNLAKGGISSFSNALSGGVELLKSAASNILTTIINVIKSLPEEVKKIGTQLIEGLWNGISEKLGWLGDQVGGVIDTVKGLFTSKDGFDEHSPSKWSEEVFENVMIGGANGLVTGLPNVLKTVDKVTDSVKDEVLMTADELNNKILAKEKELTKKLEDTGLDEATKESLNNQLEAVQSFKSEFQSAMSEIEQSQSSLADKIKDYGTLFETVETEKGDLLEISDLQSQIDLINEYGNALEKLKDRGISDSLMSEITELNIDEALSYTDKLLRMSSDQFDNYIRLWDEKQKAAAKVAEDFYKSDFESLTRQYLDKIPEELVSLSDSANETGAKIAEALNESISDEGVTPVEAILPTPTMDELNVLSEENYENAVTALTENQYILFDYINKFIDEILTNISDRYFEFRDTGLFLMEGLSQGVLDGESRLIEAVRQAVQSAIDEANSMLEIGSPSKVFQRMGDFSAQGYGIGFIDEMKNVSKDIAAAMPVSIDTATNSNILKAAEATVNGMSAGNLGGVQSPIIIQLQVSAETLAEIVFDPLRNVSKQRGVSLG